MIDANIRWIVSAGVAPFAKWGDMTTKRFIPPRIGEAVVEGSYTYIVKNVVWNYSANTVFIHVEKFR